MDTVFYFLQLKNKKSSGFRCIDEEEEMNLNKEDEGVWVDDTLKQREESVEVKFVYKLRLHTDRLQVSFRLGRRGLTACGGEKL